MNKLYFSPMAQQPLAGQDLLINPYPANVEKMVNS